MIKSMYPLIHCRTRVTDHSVTLIDNIFTNGIDDMISGIILADIRDHFPILCMSNSLHSTRQTQPIMKREISENSTHTFSSRLREEVRNIDYDDPNVKYDNFFYQFIRV